MGKLIHGHALAGRNTKTYKVWQMMRDRCENPRSTGYENYGGRGIRFCPEWASFERFLADMGEKPDGLSLERNDNDGPYSPDNCRWATRKEQNNNSRNNRWIEFRGERLTVSDWARRLGVDRRSLTSRIDNYGMSVEQALTMPFDVVATRRAKGWARTVEFRGESLTLNQWAERTGIPDNTIAARLKMGWSVEKTLTTPVRKMSPRKRT